MSVVAACGSAQRDAFAGARWRSLRSVHRDASPSARPLRTGKRAGNPSMKGYLPVVSSVRVRIGVDSCGSRENIERARWMHCTCLLRMREYYQSVWTWPPLDSRRFHAPGRREQFFRAETNFDQSRNPAGAEALVGASFGTECSFVDISRRRSGFSPVSSTLQRAASAMRELIASRKFR